MAEKYDILKVLSAIRDIHEQVPLAKEQEPDDFHYGLIKQLDDCGQKVLYLLTRGEEGTRCPMTLTLHEPNDPTIPQEIKDALK